MTLKDILVVSGQGGLFRYISKGRKSMIVENLSDHKRSTVPATSKISMLEEIYVFTENEKVSLPVVFRKIQEKENGGEAINHKSPDAELKKYFAEILPEYDRNRVYPSDFRKMVMWYNLLRELEITDFGTPEVTEEGKEEVDQK